MARTQLTVDEARQLYREADGLALELSRAALSSGASFNRYRAADERRQQALRDVRIALLREEAYGRGTWVEVTATYCGGESAGIVHYGAGQVSLFGRGQRALRAWFRRNRQTRIVFPYYERDAIRTGLNRWQVK